jgi:hypothetical protein
MVGTKGLPAAASQTSCSGDSISGNGELCAAFFTLKSIELVVWFKNQDVSFGVLCVSMLKEVPKNHMWLPDASSSGIGMAAASYS